LLLCEAGIHFTEVKLANTANCQSEYASTTATTTTTMTITTTMTTTTTASTASTATATATTKQQQRQHLLELVQELLCCVWDTWHGVDV
jgi:hypothetical protein